MLAYFAGWKSRKKISIKRELVDRGGSYRFASAVVGFKSGSGRGWDWLLCNLMNGPRRLDAASQKVLERSLSALADGKGLPRAPAAGGSSTGEMSARELIAALERDGHIGRVAAATYRVIVDEYEEEAAVGDDKEGGEEQSSSVADSDIGDQQQESEAPAEGGSDGGDGRDNSTGRDTSSSADREEGEEEEGVDEEQQQPEQQHTRPTRARQPPSRLLDDFELELPAPPPVGQPAPVGQPVPTHTHRSGMRLDAAEVGSWVDWVDVGGLGEHGWIGHQQGSTGSRGHSCNPCLPSVLGSLPVSQGSLPVSPLG